MSYGTSSGTSNFDRRELERLRYAQGQMLRGRDFRDELALADQRRWWHNRALHRAYGVARGYRVELWPDAENPTAVKVLQERRLEQVTDDKGVSSLLEVKRPGVAYDCYGRVLVITGDPKVPLPSAYVSQADCSDLGPMILVVRYNELYAGSCGTRLTGACAPGQPASSNVVFEWVPDEPASVGMEDGIPIAKVQCKDQKVELVSVVDFPAPLATPHARPYIGTGATKAGATAWEDWISGESAIGKQVRIDTSAATFTTTPHYFAWMEFAALESILPNGSKLDDNTVLTLCLHFDHIDMATATSFVFRVKSRFTDLGPDPFASITVFWIGLEKTVHAS